jgi:hypothetical protein
VEHAVNERSCRPEEARRVESDVLCDHVEDDVRLVRFEAVVPLVGDELESPAMVGDLPMVDASVSISCSAWSCSSSFLPGAGGVTGVSDLAAFMLNTANMCASRESASGSVLLNGTGRRFIGVRCSAHQLHEWTNNLAGSLLTVYGASTRRIASSN